MAAISSRRELQLKNASALLQLTRSDRVVGYDILPEAEHFSLRELKPVQFLEQYGAAYREYIELALNSEKIRNACRLAISKTRGIDHPIAANTWASYRMGGNYCDELSFDLWMQAFRQGKPAFRVYASSEDENYNHVFVIYGTDNKEFISLYERFGNDFIAIMKHAKKGTIVDPYLNFACPVTQFEGSKLAEYCEASGITTYKNSICTPAVKDKAAAEEQFAILLGEAERLIQTANKVLNTQANTNNRISALRDVLTNLPEEEKK